VKAAMEMQAEAERRKRAQILDSEGIIFLYWFCSLEIKDLLCTRNIMDEGLIICVSRREASKHQHC
jgi:hypothetical protein